MLPLLCCCAELTSDTPTRVLLNSVRYSATVGSNLFVFLVLALLIYVFELGDAGQFHTLAYVAMGVGLLTSLVFLVGTEEKRPNEEQQEHDKRSSRKNRDKLMAATASDKSMQRQHQQSLSYQQIDDDDTRTASSGVMQSPVRSGGGIQASPRNGSGDDDDLVLNVAMHSPSSYPTLDSDSSPSAALPRAPSSSGSGGNGGVSIEDSLTVRLQSLPVHFSSYRSWFGHREFFVCAFIYMCSRVVVNVSQVFLPFFVLDALGLSNVYITILPCVTYVSSMVAAGVMQRLNRQLGRVVVFLGGFGLAVAGLLGMLFLPAHAPWKWLVYPCCVLVGLGNGTIMVCCTQLTSDLIGSRTNFAAFVFGSFSFTDKLVTGVLLFVLQTFNDDSAEYARYVVSLPAIGASLLATIVILTQVDLEEWKRKHTLPPRHVARKHIDITTIGMDKQTTRQ